jgi:hypothetical protein
MNRRALALVLAGLGGCSDLGSGGAVTLELSLRSPNVVEPGDTLNDTFALKVRALDADGRVVQTPITWQVLDDTLVLVAATPPLITTNLTTGRGKAVAQAGSIVSDVATFTARPPSDTLVRTGDDTLRVLTTDTASAPLLTSVQSYAPAGSGVSGTSILYEVIGDTAAASGTVRFANGLLTLRATTAASGEPATPVTLRRVAGVAQPDSVMIQASARRPSGSDVHGSGQRFIVRFDP